MRGAADGSSVRRLASSATAASRSSAGGSSSSIGDVGTRRSVPSHGGSGVEIERKFLVAELPPDFAEHPGQRIEQGYLAIAPDGVEVRVRRRAGQATLTVKSGPGQVRIEEEMGIDERRFDALWQLTEGRRVSKTRHEIPLAGGRSRSSTSTTASSTGC